MRNQRALRRPFVSDNQPPAMRCGERSLVGTNEYDRQQEPFLRPGREWGLAARMAITKEKPMSMLRVSMLFAWAVLLGSAAVPSDAAVITFSDRASFNLAAPGLVVETFEAGLVAPSSVTVCGGPLSSGTASACFPSGALIPGVTYSAAPGGSMVVVGAGFGPVGNTSKVLGPNAFPDSLNLTFASANSVGLDVFAGAVAGIVSLLVFSPDNVPLGSFMVIAPLGGTFFGVVSDAAPVGHILITSMTSQGGELVDNLAFGTRGSTVPEPLSVVLLSIGLSAGLAARRRRPGGRYRFPDAPRD